MSSKPGVFALSKEATNFVSANIKMLFQHLKVVLPMLLICLAAQQTAQIYKIQWLAVLAALCTLFLYSCFVLAWHRTSLQGPEARNERNPFNLKGEDWKFIGVFCGITGLLGVVTNGLAYWLQTVYERHGEDADETTVAAIGVFVAMGIALFLFARASFLFPARSVGVRLGWADVRRASKGLLWPLIGANIIFVLIITVLFSVYLFVATMIVQIAAGNAPVEPMEALIATTLLKTPILVGGVVVMALCVTALSRAYQWGIQNNDIVPDQAA